MKFLLKVLVISDEDGLPPSSGFLALPPGWPFNGGSAVFLNKAYPFIRIGLTT